MQVNSDSADLEHINSLDEWTTLYKKRAVAKLAGIPTGTPNVQDALLEYLNTDCISLIDQRKHYLRCSSDYTGNKIAATICGSVPFLRPWAVHELGTDFANVTLNAFGLGDINKLQEYQRSFQETHNSKDKVVKDMALTVGRLTVTELLRDTAVDVSVEAVHIQPIIGQAVSMGYGYHRMRERMLRMMEDAAAKAVLVHQGLIIPNVMHSLKYAGSAVMDQEGICRISPACGRCDRCNRAFEWDECIWLFRGVPEILFGAVTYCESCQVKEDRLDSPTSGCPLTFINKVATEDMNRWTCMSQECKSGSNVRSFDDAQFVCPDGSSRRCLLCILSEEGRECPQCRLDYNDKWTPHQLIRSKQMDRACRRPLIVCSICHEIQPQGGAFLICEGCMADGGRTVFCTQCLQHGHPTLHFDLCRSRRPDAVLRGVNVSLVRLANKAAFYCLACHITYSTSIPYAHCTSVTDNQSLYICYVCFFTTFKNTSKYCIENLALSDFVLYLLDVPEEEQSGADSDAGDAAIIHIPGPSYFSKRASEQEGKAVLKSCMIETVHWLTKSHVGCRDAARIGLMGPARVDATHVPWPGMALPPMKEADFQSTSTFSNMEYEIPHYELGYLNCGIESAIKT